MSTTSKIAFTEGSGKNGATYSISEDAVTKEIARVTLNSGTGTEISTLPVSLTSTTITGTIAATQSGAWNITNAGTFAVQAAQSGTWTAKILDSGGTSITTGAGASDAHTLRVTMDTGQVSSLGQAVMASSAPVAVASNQSWPTGMSPRAFQVAFATLTRPANVTAYTAGDSISDNATAGSVTALVSGNIADTNDDPLTLTEILIDSTDTGLAGKRIRAYVYRSNPTASTGVGGGDNAAFSNKKAGYIGSFAGTLETGFSDGTVGRLVPTFNNTNGDPAGSFIVTLPVSAAKTLYVQYQAVDAFTPSANSTTIIGTIRGFQGRAS
jgi:hypothetical protein